MADDQPPTNKFKTERTKGSLHKHSAAPPTRNYSGDGTVQPGQTFSVDPTVLAGALSTLVQLSGGFDGQVTSAAGLPQEIPAGYGPIGVAVGQRFNHRLSEHSGLQYAMARMRDQIDVLIASLTSTTNQYIQANETAVATLNAVRQQLENRT